MNFELIKRQKGKAPRLRTHCKVCLLAILEGDATIWRTSTPLGLIHEECK